MPDGIRYEKNQAERRNVVESAEVTATGTGSEFRLPVAPGHTFLLAVTAAATLAGDTLDVFVQTQVEDGQWLDVVAFTQVLGNGAVPQRHVAKIEAGEAQAMYEAGTALAAGSVRNHVGDKWRVRWVVAGTGAFTFAVWACPN